MIHCQGSLCLREIQVDLQMETKGLEDKKNTTDFGKCLAGI